MSLGKGPTECGFADVIVTNQGTLEFSHPRAHEADRQFPNSKKKWRKKKNKKLSFLRGLLKEGCVFFHNFHEITKKG